jgi:CarD family transcriptional regulator
MRTVMDAEKVGRIYEILRDRESPTDTQTWNRRYREYMAKIKTGDPLEVAKVLRDLALMKVEKNLSFGERKMYDQARSLLVQEISTARDVDEKVVEGEIEAIFVPPDAAESAAPAVAARAEVVSDADSEPAEATSDAESAAATS